MVFVAQIVENKAIMKILNHLAAKCWKSGPFTLGQKRQKNKCMDNTEKTISKHGRRKIIASHNHSIFKRYDHI